MMYPDYTSQMMVTWKYRGQKHFSLEFFDETENGPC